MAIKPLKKKSLSPKANAEKTSLNDKAVKNTTITKSKPKEEPEVLKEGTPLEHTNIHNISKSPRTVGVNIGVTKNMSNYESLRADCWLTDEVQDGETHEEAIQRIFEIAQDQITKQVDELTS